MDFKEGVFYSNEKDRELVPALPEEFSLGDPGKVFDLLSEAVDARRRAARAMASSVKPGEQYYLGTQTRAQRQLMAAQEIGAISRVLLTHATAEITEHLLGSS